MARSVYIAGLSPGAGKSLVALGVAELLSRRVASLGVFRPVVAGPDDPLLTMLRERYRVEGAPPYGVTDAQAGRLLADGRVEELVGEVVARFRAVADEHPVTVVVGTTGHPGYPTGGGVPRNGPAGRLATEMGSSVIAVVDGHRGELANLVDAVRGGYHALGGADADVLAIVVNRVPPRLRRPLLDALTTLPVPVYAIPEFAGRLRAHRRRGGRGAGRAPGWSAAPTRTPATCWTSWSAAPTVPMFLDHLRDGCLVITPGDRADLIVAALAAHVAGHGLSLAGLC